MHNTLKIVLVALATAGNLSLASAAHAFDVKAGPIWNNPDAQNKCPNVCEWYGGWNGNWTTTVWGQMSVCGCHEEPQGDSHDANAGPIWNHADAQNKCPTACLWYGGWNGNWRTTVWGEMSVCGCKQSLR